MHAWMLSFFAMFHGVMFLPHSFLDEPKKLLSHMHTSGCKQCFPSQAETEMGIGDLDFPPTTQQRLQFFDSRENSPFF